MEKVWVHVSHACVHHKTQISTGPKTWEKLLKLYILLWAGVMHLCQSFSSSHTRNIRIGTTPKVAKRPSSATSLHLWLVFIEVVVLDKLSGNQSINPTTGAEKLWNMINFVILSGKYGLWFNHVPVCADNLYASLCLYGSLSHNQSFDLVFLLI